MADIYKGLTVKIGGESSGLTKALREAKKEASGTHTQLNMISKALKMDPGNTALVTQQMSLYGKQISSTEKQLEALYAANEQGQDSMSTEQWTKLQTDITLAENRLRQYNEQLEKAATRQAVNNTSLGKAANAVEAFGNKYNAAGQTMQNIGSTMTRTVTPAMIGIGAASIAAAVDIDSSLTSVRKTVDGTEQQYQELKQSAIEFSKTNAVSASQILDIQALGAQLGFAIEELDMFSQVVSGLDIATDMDAETAATQLAQFANITKMSHGEVENYASSLVGLGNNFATTESKISDMAMRIAASGTQVGMSQADILGVATALSSLGVEAEAGGTAISTIMASIDKDVALNNDNLQTWASTAQMSAEDFANAWKNDPVAALSAVLSGMEGATSEGSNMSVMLDELGITSLRQTDVMKRLAGNSDLMAEAVAKSNSEWSANTALTKEVENRNQSLDAKFQMLKNQAIAVGESIGGPLADALLDAISAMQPLFQAISDGAKAFADMDEGGQRTAITLGGLVVAAGPLINMAGKLITNSGKIADVMRKVAAVSPSVKKEATAIATAHKVQATAGTAVAASNTAIASTSKVAAVGTKALAVGMNVLKAAAPIAIISALVAVVSGIAGKMEEGRKHTENMSKALGGVAAANEKAASAFETSKNSSDSYSRSLIENARSVQEAAEAQAELNDSMNETWTDLGASGGALEKYKGIIAELAGQSNLSAEDQARLQSAVQGVNEITGSTIEVIDAQNGLLNQSTDLILANADAWLQQAKAQAAQEMITEKLKEQYQIEQDISGSKAKIEELQKRVNEATDEYTKQEFEAMLRDENEALADKEKLLEANKQDVTDLTNIVEESASATKQSASAVKEWAGSFEGIGSTVESNGQSLDGFSQAIADLGLTQQQMADMTPETLAQLAQAWDGSVESIKPILDSYKASVSSSLDQGTRDAIAGMQTAITEGTALTQPQVDTLRTVLEQATSGLDAETSANTWEALNGILGALSSGQPLTAEQVAMLNSVLSGVGVEFAPAATSNTQAGVDELTSTISGGTGQAESASSELEGAAASGLDDFKGEAGRAADEGVAQYVQRVISGRGQAQSGGTTMAQGALAGARSVSGTSAGSDFASGYARGISMGAGAVGAAASALAQRALASVKAAQDSNSPSKESMALGEDYGEGYGIGIKNMYGLVKRNSIGLTKAALNTSVAQAQLSQPATSAYGGATTVYHLYLNDWEINDTEKIRTITVDELSDIVLKGQM